jgi:hypothetical protein
MSIAWRPAAETDLELGLSIQVRNWGDALVAPDAALNAWRHLRRNPFFASVVLEANPAIGGWRLVGFGASVLIARAFADSEIANPRPDINSRVIAAVHSGRPVLATPNEVARANAREGVDVLVLAGNWRDDILSPEERHEVKTLLATTFTESHAGYRIRRILSETSDEPAREFHRRSIVYEVVAEFPGCGRVLFSMTRESVQAVPGSLGNVLFSYRAPVLRLRHSDRQLLGAALQGLKDRELAAELGIGLSAVKGRWRSTFARFEEAMPGFLNDVRDRDSRGGEKRHRVLAYVRNHFEELRPYDWKTHSQTFRPGNTQSASAK